MKDPITVGSWAYQADDEILKEADIQNSAGHLDRGNA